MIKIKSNIDSFLNKYRKKCETFKTSLREVAEKLAKRMSEDMFDIISKNEDVWAINDKDNFNDESGKMAFHKGKNLEDWFTIESIGDNAMRVSIGDNLRKHEMEDGSLVNPAYFVEFGFGIVGQDNPMKNADRYNWRYNKNGHIEAWTYEGWDGLLHESSGAKGINFMYNTIQDYKNNWLKYLNELMENANA